MRMSMRMRIVSSFPAALVIALASALTPAGAAAGVYALPAPGLLGTYDEDAGYSRETQVESGLALRTLGASLWIEGEVLVLPTFECTGGTQHCAVAITCRMTEAAGWFGGILEVDQTGPFATMLLFWDESDGASQDILRDGATGVQLWIEPAVLQETCLITAAPQVSITAAELRFSAFTVAAEETSWAAVKGMYR